MCVKGVGGWGVGVYEYIFLFVDVVHCNYLAVDRFSSP